MTSNATSQQLSSDLPTATRRPPATVIIAAVLTILVASVGTYGSVYFSLLDGYDDVDVPFISMYGYLALIGIVSAIAQLRGSAIGQAGIIAWGIYGVLFTLVKLVTIQEMEAIGFGVVALIVVALSLAGPSRRFVRSRNAA